MSTASGADCYLIKLYSSLSNVFTNEYTTYINLSISYNATYNTSSNVKRIAFPFLKGIFLHVTILNPYLFVFHHTALKDKLEQEY